MCTFSPSVLMTSFRSYTSNQRSSSTYGTLVFNCTPCQAPISFSRTLFTILCCASIPSPRNRSLAISIAYMLPQPPETSRTTSSTGCRLATSCSKTERSLASRSAGGSRGVCGCEAVDELYSLVERGVRVGVVGERGRPAAGYNLVVCRRVLVDVAPLRRFLLQSPSAILSILLEAFRRPVTTLVS